MLPPIEPSDILTVLGIVGPIGALIIYLIREVKSTAIQVKTELDEKIKSTKAEADKSVLDMRTLVTHVQKTLCDQIEDHTEKISENLVNQKEIIYEMKDKIEDMSNSFLRHSNSITINSARLESLENRIDLDDTRSLVGNSRFSSFGGGGEHQDGLPVNRRYRYRSQRFSTIAEGEPTLSINGYNNNDDDDNTENDTTTIRRRTPQQSSPDKNNDNDKQP